MPISVRYSFTQHFAVSAQKAFDWSTSFDAKDNTLMKHENAKRQITQISEDVVFVEDTFHASV